MVTFSAEIKRNCTDIKVKKTTKKNTQLNNIIKKKTC